MNAVVEKALDLWGMENARYQLVAARENAVFEVRTETQSFALRLHRKEYRTDAELWSELKWMETIGQGGISVPAPITSVSGEVLHIIDGVQVDVLTWLSGTPMGKTGAPLKVADRYGLFHKIGQEMARLHQISDAWTLPDTFARCAWDKDGLLGETPLWNRFWDNPALSSSDRDLFLRFRQKADDVLSGLGAQLDYGLIHADMVRENILVDGAQIQVIDFDDGGFGYRHFDIATALLKNMNEPDYLKLRDALIAGYTAQRAIDLSTLDLFVALRSATYVGWIISRIDEDGSDIRNTRFIALTRRLIKELMD